jgi:hypothetical protein
MTHPSEASHPHGDFGFGGAARHIVKQGATNLFEVDFTAFWTTRKQREKSGVKSASQRGWSRVALRCGRP